MLKTLFFGLLIVIFTKNYKKYIYTVLPGDSLSSISREFNVSIQKIKKWNRNKRLKILRPGMKLVIYSSIPVRKKRKMFYTVKKGDSLWKIAKKLKISQKRLMAYNRMNKHSVLHPGKVLKYYVYGPAKKSKAIGFHASGRLINGEKLPFGPGYFIKQPEESYGTNETITYLLHCIAKFRKKYRNAGNILIGDISLKKGGIFPPHLSHQNGLDVDIGYFHKGKKQPKRFIRVTKKNIDIPKTWYFINCLLKTKKVKFIFMDGYIQKMFYAFLVKKYGKRKKWKKLFEIKSGKRKGVIFLKSKGHSNHYHVRFFCSPEDKKCRNN